MKKVIIFLFTISIAAFGQQPSESLEGKIILMLKYNTSLSDSVKDGAQNKTGNFKIDEINRLHQSLSVTKQQLGRKTNKCIYIIQFPLGTNLKPVIDAYYKTGEIDYAEPDYVGAIGGTLEVIPNDQNYNRQWGLHNDGTFPPGLAVVGADLDMQNAWDIELGDSSIIVGILDTGVKFDHPELAGRTWINYNEIPGNLIDDDANGYIDDVKGWNWANSNNNPVDGNGHGTNIAGIIGANSNNVIGYSGVDWNCKLMTLKGINDSGSWSVSWLANAIYYAVDNGARVINMSFGNTNNPITFQDAVNYALKNNVVLVACMMNQNSNTVFYPAAYIGVIAVGSTDWDDTRSQPFPWDPNSGSNWGDHISVVAPGNVIFGLDYLSNTNYDIFFSGTSQATAHVSGVAALLLAQDPDRTPGDIKYILEASAEDTIGDPIEDIPGWDPYYGFGRVNAYYALLYSQPCLPEGIIFTTQAEIDNFQTNYPGCTEIEGEVTINGTDITNLNGLNVLTYIGGNLWIEYNNALTSLTGLENLVSIGGDLYIGDLYYGGNPALTSLSGLDNLTSIGGYLVISWNGVLTSLNGLDNLTSIGHDLVISWNGVLTSLIGLDNLTSIGSALGISYNDALTSLSGLDNLTSIGGYLSIYDNYALTILSGLDNLTSIGGDLDISDNNVLTSLSGLDNLTSIGGDLKIYSNDALTSLNGLESLSSIGGGFNISSNEALTSLSGLENLTSIGGNLNITDNGVLTSLSGLDNLTSIGGFISIYDNNALISLNGLENITSIGGGLAIEGNSALTSLSGLDNLTYIGGSLGIQYNYALTSLSGLDNLTSIGGELWIWGNSALSSLTGLNKVTSIGGDLSIYTNDALTSLSGLDNLTSIGGYLNISHNEVLISLSGLENIEAGTITDLTIKYNSSLSMCVVQSICDYLAAPNGTVSIYVNASGCNTAEEVIQACQGISVEEINPDTGFTITPNPATGIITISLPGSTGIVWLTIFNTGGGKVLERQLTGTETQIDISTLPQGIYFVRLQNERMVEVGKMVKD